MKNVQGPKRKLSMTNPQFDFQKESSWREDGKSQQGRGSSYIQYYPFKPTDEQLTAVDSHLKDQQICWAFGPKTRFKIKGQFQGMTPSKGELKKGKQKGQGLIRVLFRSLEYDWPSR